MDLSLLVGICTSLTFLFTLVVSLLIHELLSPGEVALDLLIAGHATRFLNPGVLIYLLHRGSMVRLQGHHLLEEVLEFGRVNVIAFLSLRMRLPEEIWPSSSDEAIMGIIRVG